ncbi:DEAD/DEAH box helicase [Fulvivirga sp. M361]|uniref:DEAD/DEAH box helicase family protein n=1 Tax=Fulvivirga sp. M361 TaxID=2594266 RepID=UPI00117AC9B2|nr:DEAD/DEAH box helicase family protein [Fulvivirga sp. M361]TRX49643.1 DEAD/DEAH box helicase [Fulvivirga sp. M361]
MLRDADFRMVYATGEDEPIAFYIEALMESHNLDLGLGFFSSSGFKVLSHGFAYFLSRGGKMRLIINNILTPQDKEAIEKGQETSTERLIEDRLVADIISLQKTLSKQDQHFFNCLSWLISKDKLSIVAIVPRNNAIGIAHQKFGVFSDQASDKVAFTGSLNFSESAFLYNVETISCYRSWTTENERVNYYNTLFRKIWTGQNSSVQFISIDKVKTHITSSFPTSGIDELLKTELSLIEEQLNVEIPGVEKLKQLQGRIRKSKLLNTRDTNDIKPREYQKEAIANWINSGYKGFFEMATGTGKTFTGLFASLSLKSKNKKCFLLILVPTISLGEQWKEEVRKVGYQNILMVSSNYSGWDKHLASSINAFKLGAVDNTVCISTYDSYKTDKFQLYIDKLPAETLLIADEAHAMGASQMLQKMPHGIKYRLGLSATPHRHFDDSGTSRLLEFFNAEHFSTYQLNLKQAIADGHLCQYKLYPHFATLNDSEFAEYLSITKRIAKKIHLKQGEFEEQDPHVEKLLRDRRNILNKAESKLVILNEIIEFITSSEGEVKHTLVYCPEGSTPEEDARIIDHYGKFLGLEKGLRIGKFVGETSPEERQKLLKDFDEGKTQCLLAMKCLDEGVDVKQTKTAIFLASSTNPRQYIQRRGRVLRTHKKKSFAHLHDILAIPPELQESEETLRVEKAILNQELRRYREFADDAYNYVEAVEPLKPILEKYGLEL